MAEFVSALPAFFEPLLASQYAPDDMARILEGCAQRRATTLRANALKASRAEIAAVLDAAGIAWDPVDWYGDAFVLRDADERAMAALPAYQEGKLYLQSLSSMLPPLVLGPRPGADILDMCAAPGGKTTQMAALAGGQAHISACEMHAPRAEKLRFNLDRQGATAVNIMRTDARRLDDFFSFDQILLDAPCSGSGTVSVFDPKMPQRFTPALVEKSVKAQHALLSKALRLVKPGGTLVYSTCSVLRRENEEVVRACLAQANTAALYRVRPIALPGIDGLPLLPTDLDGALTVCPTDRYEGFFVVRIEREA